MGEIVIYRLGINKSIPIVVHNENEKKAVRFANNETGKEKSKLKTIRKYTVDYDDQVFDAGFLSFSNDSPVAYFDLLETRKIISYGLSYLTPKQRNLIEEIYFEGKTISQFAREHGLNQKTAWECHESAIKRLRTILKDYSP